MIADSVENYESIGFAVDPSIAQPILIHMMILY